MDMRADLLIVGAGMVGSALALALKDSGLKIRLLDGSPLSVKPFAAQTPFEPRVSALSAASQRILQRLGAWEGITRRRVSPYAHMQVWDGSGTHTRGSALSTLPRRPSKASSSSRQKAPSSSAIKYSACSGVVDQTIEHQSC